MLKEPDEINFNSIFKLNISKILPFLCNKYKNY